MQNIHLSKKIEKLIDPLNVGTMQFMQSYIKAIPVSVQNKIITTGSKQNPYMGFVVEPYSFFLCYELADLNYAAQLVPDNYTLVKTKIFKEDKDAKYYCIFSCFNVHSSAFWGTRMEFYLIAENNATGLLSWVIIDYSTNTISFNPKSGLIGGNTKDCVLTTTFNGEVVVDIKSKDGKNNLIFESNLNKKREMALFQRLWLEGNLSVAYGKELSNNSGDAFSVSFDPKEVEKAWSIPLTDVQIEANTWFPGLFAEQPAVAVCFPFAQHYLSDSPGHYSLIHNENELVEKIKAVNFDTLPKYSSQPLRKMFVIGQIASLCTSILLLLLLILK